MTSSGARFMHYDAQRSIRVLTQSSGETVDRYSFDAFGRRIRVNGSTPNAYGFTGERRDESTGLLYLRARQYDPSTGRFLGPDSFLGFSDVPLTLHRFVYAGNDPLLLSDPSGRFVASFGMALSIGSILINTASNPPDALGPWLGKGGGRAIKSTGRRVVLAVATLQVEAALATMVQPSLDSYMPFFYTGRVSRLGPALIRQRRNEVKDKWNAMFRGMSNREILYGDYGDWCDTTDNHNQAFAFVDPQNPKIMGFCDRFFQTQHETKSRAQIMLHEFTHTSAGGGRELEDETSPLCSYSSRAPNDCRGLDNARILADVDPFLATRNPDNYVWAASTWNPELGDMR